MRVMTARRHPSSVSILPLPLLMVLLLAISPVSHEEPTSSGGDLSSSDGETPVLGDDLLHGEEESSDVENDPSPSESKGESPFVKDFLSATEGRAASGVESPSVEDDPSFQKGEPGRTGDNPTEGALGLSLSETKTLAIVNSSKEESGEDEEKDDIISRISVGNTVQRDMPAVRSLRREPLHGGSAARHPHIFEGTSAQYRLHLCKSMYMTDYGVYPFDHFMVYLYRHEKDVFPMIIFVQKEFVDLCRHLFISEECEEQKFLTLCIPAKIGFLHSHGCQRQEVRHFEKLLASYLLDGNTECFEGLCDGSYRLIDSSIGGITYQIFNIIHPYEYKMCNNRLFSNRYMSDLNSTVYLTQNNNWPCCFALYLVAWQERPEDHDLNGNWSYLPASCRVGEALLIMMVAVVGLSGVAGNLIVVVVMLGSAHRGQESSLLRTSLAFSDLLLGVFVVLPSFFYHLAPFFKPPEYMTLTGDERFFISHVVKRDAPLRISNDLPSKDGFLLFQSLVYGTCTLVSLLTMCLLSTERLVMTGRALRYKHYITRGRIKAAIVSTWVLGLLETLLGYYDRYGNISTLWSTFPKVPRRFPEGAPSDLAYAFFSNLHVSLYILAGIVTAVFSVLSLYNFLREQSRVKTEWQSHGIKTTALYYQENRRIITTMTLMIALYLASVVTTPILMIMNTMEYRFIGIHLFGYLSVWLLLASSAWNPWLYNMRSSRFTGDLAQLLHKVLPTSLGERLRPYMTHLHYGNEWDTIELTPGRKKMLFRLGLAET